jgi:methyl acetate hydrolase
MLLGNGTSPDGVPILRPETVAWAGLANTHYWVDRTTGVTGAIYSQFLPFIPPEALQLYADVETALYATL